MLADHDAVIISFDFFRHIWYNDSLERTDQTMRQYDTIIFDLDGTLLNTLEDLADSTNEALMRNGLPTRSLEEVRRFVGNGVARLIHLAVPEDTSPELEAKCLEEFKAHYLTNMRNKTGPYPGILGLLEALGKQDLQLAVVSNKFDAAVKELCADYFGSLVPLAMGERPGLEKKPAPDLVFRALEELGANPSHAVYVGDSEVDLQTARNAHLPCLAVSWGFRDRAFLTAHGAGTIVDTPEELLGLLL